MKVEAATASLPVVPVEGVAELRRPTGSLQAEAGAAHPPEAKTEPGTFHTLVARLNNEVNSHEAHVRALMNSKHGTALGPEELLALQGEVNRYSTLVELTSKVAQQGTQSVQTVIKSGGQ